jgi:hypothetical protein
MLIYYNGVVLCPGGISGEVFGWTQAQKLVIDPAELFRATAMTYYSRGNLSTDLSFSVRRQFASRKDAEVYAMLHAATLANKATLMVIAGDGANTQQLNLQNAVLVSVTVKAEGVEAEAAYTFQAGSFDSTDIPVPGAGQDYVKRFAAALTIGTDYIDVVFDTPFGVTPTAVIGNIAMPAGGFSIPCTPDLSTLTASAVRFYFGATIPAANYQLMGAAFL